MGRRETDVNHLSFSVAKVLQKETGTLGQVPTVGCQSGGLRMHVWFKWIKLGLPAAGSKQSWDSHLTFILEPKLLSETFTSVLHK